MSGRLTLWPSPGRASGSVVLLLVLALALSLFYTGQNLYFYAGSCLLALAALPVAIWRPQSPAYLVLGPAGFVLLALFLWTAAATAWSSVPYNTQINAGLIGAALLHYLVWRLLNPVHGVPRMAVAAALGIGGAVTAVLLVQIALGQRPTASFLNPNTAAGFVNLLWPLAAVLALSATVVRRHRTLLLAMVAGMVFALSYDGSRAALLALAAALTVLLMGGGRIAPLARRAALAAVVLGAVLLAQASGGILASGSAAGAAQPATLVDPATAGASRLRIWEATAEMIAVRPWLGFGPGTFFQAYPAWRPPGDGSAAFHVHNDYLQYWVEGGLPALILLFAFLAVAAGLFLQGARQRDGDERSTLARLAVAAALAGTAVHALFSYNLQVMPYLLVVAGLAAALDAAAPARFHWGLPLARLRRGLVPAAVFIGALLLPAIHVGAIGLSDYYTDRGVRHIEAQRPDAADRDFERARQVWDDQDAAWTFHADLYRRRLESIDPERTDHRQQLRRAGLELLDGAVARNPLRAHTHSIRGEILLQPPHRDPEAAKASFRLALRLDPRFIDARVALIERLREQGASDAAWQALQPGLELEYSRRSPVPLLRIGIALARERGQEVLVRNLQERLRAHYERRVPTY